MTLIEILAVVVILGMLAVVLTVSFSGKMGKAKREIAKTQIGQIAGQIELYQLEKHRLPDAGTLSALSSAPDASYYIEPAKLIDPWGKALLYIVPGPEGHAFEVVSYGSDGQPGGTGDAADVSSANLGDAKP
ncbi:MAG: type II secretion system protein GspG [Planctomycetes bacterium]|nr:type II secretion system protein GspG [Planctomycetota bacterium]